VVTGTVVVGFTVVVVGEALVQADARARPIIIKDIVIQSMVFFIILISSIELLLIILFMLPAGFRNIYTAEIMTGWGLKTPA